ncbi:MAG: cytochrome c4 [Betaproteobacteria bacterium]|nr:cytochrome c4 [Betaproteobacteria bacterium]
MKFRWSVQVIAGMLAASSAFAQAPAKGDPAKGERIATQLCAACHAADGNSPQPANPVLAGQHAEYTVKQLMDFKPQGGKPAERGNPIMAGMVAGLTAEDMRNVGAYYENKKPAARAARDAELVKLGQVIYRGGNLSKGITACAACHGPNGAGVPAMFPRLAGQHAEYVAAQLKAFRAGERANDPGRMMRMIAGKLSDKEIAAVADFIAGLR